jgi:hypothetical protein
MFRPTLLAAIVAALALPAFAADTPAEQTQVYYAHNRLNYDGDITADANKKLYALYESLHDKPTVLSILSGGGPADLGMELGEWVHAHKLDVRVVEFCMSSCANYVFPAAIHKTVSNFAIIGYHGGMKLAKFALDEQTQKMYDAMTADQQKAFMDGIHKSMQPLADREHAFLASIGVSDDLTTLGQQERYQRLYRDEPKVIGWSYSLEDFARLGVRDITVINPPWKPTTLRGGESFMQLRIK